jgi:hypothetical protein
VAARRFWNVRWGIGFSDRLTDHHLWQHVRVLIEATAAIASGGQSGYNENFEHFGPPAGYLFLLPPE